MSMSHPLILACITKRWLLLTQYLHQLQVKTFIIWILALAASFAVVFVQMTKVAASPFSFSCLNFFFVTSPTLMRTVCNYANICWCAMELCSLKIYHTMISGTFDQKERLHCQNWCLCAANIPHSTHLFVNRSHLQICLGHFTFQYLLNFKAPWPSWVSWWEVCNFRILIPPVFHHPFDH